MYEMGNNNEDIYKFKTLIFGASQSAREMIGHLSDNNFNIIAVYDVNLNASQAFGAKYNIPTLSHFEEIETLDYDAVILTTPTQNRFSLCKYFASKNKFVFCKAPLYRTNLELDEYEALGVNLKKYLHPIFIDDFNAILSKISSIITSKKYGNISQIEIYLTEKNYNLINKNDNLISYLAPKLCFILQELNLSSKVTKWEESTITKNDDEVITSVKAKIKSADLNVLINLDFMQKNNASRIKLISHNNQINAFLDSSKIFIHPQGELEGQPDIILQIKNNDLEKNQLSYPVAKGALIPQHRFISYLLRKAS